MENANPFDPPEFLEAYDIVSDAESVDTPLVSPFLDFDDESNNGEMIGVIALFSCWELGGVGVLGFVNPHGYLGLKIGISSME
ncbi:hypothetical protein Tco_1292720 [Tanacetum coccineum]